MTIFLTPDNERSFSALIDRVILETGRIGSLLSVAGWANQVIRECQALGLFRRDRIEDQIVPTGSPYIWYPPRYFRTFAQLRFATQDIVPTKLVAGMRTSDCPAYYYAADDYFVFAGYMSGEAINYLAYMWAKPLRYFARDGENTAALGGGPYTTREAFYNTDADTWYYWDGTQYMSSLGNTVLEALYRQNAMNWLVDEWFELIKEGTKAKVWNSFGDARATAAYASYKAQQTLMRNTVGFEQEA